MQSVVNDRERESDNIEIDFGTIPCAVIVVCSRKTMNGRKNVDWLNFYRFQLGFEQKPETFISLEIQQS